MKKIGLFLIVILVAMIFVGCGNKNFSYPVVYRDDYNTGGNINFEYQPISHTIIFGGENQVIQYYDKNIAKCWNEEGNRVGFKMIPPTDLDNYQSGFALINDKKLSSDEFYKLKNEDGTLIAEFCPIVDENNRDIIIKITWQEGIEEQIYHLKIKNGTIFNKKE